MGKPTPALLIPRELTALGGLGNMEGYSVLFGFGQEREKIIAS